MFIPDLGSECFSIPDPGIQQNKEQGKNKLIVVPSVADPDPFDTDPDPACHFDTDPDPAFQFDTDPDPYCFTGNVTKTVLFIHLLIFLVIRSSSTRTQPKGIRYFVKFSLPVNVVGLIRLA
jgi:hypothetical protein